MNDSGKIGHPCPVPCLKRNAFSFSSWSIFAVGFIFAVGHIIYGLYYVEIGSLFAHFLESFHLKSVLSFVKNFFLHTWDNHMVFILQPVNMLYHIWLICGYWKFFHLWNKSHLIMTDIILMYCWGQFANKCIPIDFLKLCFFLTYSF